MSASSNITSDVQEAGGRLLDALYEQSPIPIWLEDFSAARIRLDEIRNSGVADIRSHLSEHREDLHQLACLVRIIDVNLACLNFFGVRNKEEIPRDLPSYFDESSWASFAEEMAALASGATSFHCETVILGLNGLRRTAALWLVVVPGCEATLARVLVSFVDVTKRVLAEQALRESRERLRLAHDAARVGTWEWDLKTNENHWADELWQLYGLVPNSCAPSFDGWLETIHPEDREETSQHVINAARTGTEINTTWRVNDDSSPHRWLMSRGRPLRDKDGNIERYIGVVMDITDQKQADIELRHREALMRYIVRHDPNAIAVCDRNMCYLAVSAHFLSDYGVTEADVIGRCHYDIFPDIPERWKEVHRRCLLGAVEHNDDDSFRRPDGSITYNRWECRPWHQADGTIGGIILYSEVTTDRKRLEEQLRQAHKMEAIGQLAGGIAHDFNNLLMAIIGHTELALGEIPRGTTAGESLREIEQASKHAAVLCRQMLAYAGRGVFIQEPLELSPLIRSMADTLKAAVPDHITLQLECADGLPSALADAVQLTQVVLSLVTNAAESIAGSGGTVVVRTGRMTVTESSGWDTAITSRPQSGDYVYLQVADTGCGMEADTLRRAFDPFFTTKFTGRGLGLSAVMGIVRAHNGGIRIESAPGVGTTVQVLLPVAPEPRAAQAPTPPATSAEEARTVLLVDDEEAVRSVGRRLLDRCGYRALVASDGPEAIGLYREHHSRIVCVLLDLTMPTMDGEEVLRQLRGIDKDVRVVISSGYTEQEIRTRLDGAGIAGFMQKPYRLNDLAAVLRAVTAPRAQ